MVAALFFEKGGDASFSLFRLDFLRILADLVDLSSVPIPVFGTVAGQTILPVFVALSAFGNLLGEFRDPFFLSGSLTSRSLSLFL